jgi:hypothetical protein
VETIGENAFQGTGIENIGDMPDSVTSIGDSAFAGCMSLQSTEGLSTNLVSIPKRAFLSCTNITTMGTIPASSTKIDAYSYAQCSSMTNGTIEDVLSEIGTEAFIYVGENAEPTADDSGLVARTHIDARKMWCGDLIGKLSAHTNTNPFIKFTCRDGYVMYINGEWKAFYKVVTINMENVFANTRFYVGKIVPEEGYSVEIDWGDGTASMYTNGVSHVYTKRGNYSVSLLGFMKSIGGTDSGAPILYTSSGINTNIVSFSIGGTSHLSELGAYCFAGCTSLRTLNGFSASLVQSLGTNCFARCTSLTTLEGLPGSLEEMGVGCFRGCTGLRDLNHIPDACTYIPSFGFEGCTGLTSLTNLNTSITTFGDCCFKDCTGLSTLEGMGNQEGVVFDEGVFIGCTGLSSLQGFNTNSALSVSCFEGCTGLASLKGMPSTIVTIPSGCFLGCIGLSNLLGMAESCQLIEYSAFSNCTGIVSLEGCSTNLIGIGPFAFAGCSITNLGGISAALLEIGDFAFTENKALADISDIVSCTNEFTFGEGCFYGCELLGTNNIVQSLPPNTKQIGVRAFAECPYLDIAELPEPVTEIGTAAFAGCWMRSLSAFPTNCPTRRPPNSSTRPSESCRPKIRRSCSSTTSTSDRYTKSPLS